MRRLFLLLLVLIASVWIGLKIAEDPGYALFVYQKWSVEMPLWFVAVSFLIILLLLYMMIRFFDNIDFSLYRWKNWLRWRRKYKAYSKTNRGLIELIEGHWSIAEDYLTVNIEQSDAPLINFLGAAKAAHEQRAFDRRDHYLRKAHQLAPQAEIAIGLTQAHLQFEQGQLEQAIATLGHLQSIAPKQEYVLKLLERVYVRLADWQGLINILPRLRKAKIITENQYQKFEENAYQELLRSAANKNVGLLPIQQVWHAIPKKIKCRPQLIYSYTQLILPYPEAANESEDLIYRAIKKNWHKDLVRLYGLLKTSDPKKQLARAEDWCKQYGSHAVLFLTLGRLTERCDLWGKAKNYFEESIKLDANPETYAEYGKLLEELGDFNLAMQNYRIGLQLSEHHVH